MAHFKLANFVMVNINGGHGQTLLDTKLLAFIIQLCQRKGNQGSECAHTGLPLALADSPMECQEATLLHLHATACMIHELFGIELNFKGGLTSDNANAHIDACM